MSGSAAVQLKQVDTFDGMLFDSHGEKVTPQKGFMVKLDQKGSEQITVSRNTLWLMGVVLTTGIPLLMLLFYWGGSFLGIIRNDESKTKDIQQLQTDVKQLSDTQKRDIQALRDEQKEGFRSMSSDIKDIQKTMTGWEIKKSFELGAQQGAQH